MFGTKVFLSSSLLLTTSTGSIFVSKNGSSKYAAECEPTSAEQGAADLDKIFGQAAAEGGIPPDPEEI